MKLRSNLYLILTCNMHDLSVASSIIYNVFNFRHNDTMFIDDYTADTCSYVSYFFVVVLIHQLWRTPWSTLVTCQRFLSQMCEAFVLLFEHFQQYYFIFEHCQKCPRMFQRPLSTFKAISLDKVKCHFGIFLGILNLIFLINHVLNNNLSRFLSPAWEVALEGD